MEVRLRGAGEDEVGDLLELGRAGRRGLRAATRARARVALAASSRAPSSPNSLT